MHLPDLIELAKECRHRLSAKKAEVHVFDNGEIEVSFWGGMNGAIYEIISPFKIKMHQLQPCRTPEDALAMVDAWIAEQVSKVATASDFGITEDGKPLHRISQAAE